MMYEEQVQNVKKARKLSCCLVVPFCLFGAIMPWIMGLVFTGAFPQMPGLLFNLVFSAIALTVGAIFLRGDLVIDRRLAKMKAAVNAYTDADMNLLMEASCEFGGEYYISPEYVLNFHTLTAYPRSRIQDAKCYTSTNSDGNSHVTVTHYCIRIRYGGGQEDRMVFRRPQERDQAYAFLTEGAQFLHG